MTSQNIRKLQIGGAALALLVLGVTGVVILFSGNKPPEAPVVQTPAPTAAAPVVNTPAPVETPAPQPQIANNPQPQDPQNQQDRRQQIQARLQDAQQRVQQAQQDWAQGKVTVQQQTGPDGRPVLTLNNGNQTTNVPLPAGVQVQQNPGANGQPGNLTVTLQNGRVINLPAGIPNRLRNNQNFNGQNTQPANGTTPAPEQPKPQN